MGFSGHRGAPQRDATSGLDASGSGHNGLVRLTDAKALGLAATLQAVGAGPSACDACTRFGKAFTGGFDPGDGIAPASYDLVGIAARGVGHPPGISGTRRRARASGWPSAPTAWSVST